MIDDPDRCLKRAGVAEIESGKQGCAVQREGDRRDDTGGPPVRGESCDGGQRPARFAAMCARTSCERPRVEHVTRLHPAPPRRSVIPESHLLIEQVRPMAVAVDRQQARRPRSRAWRARRRDRDETANRRSSSTVPVSTARCKHRDPSLGRSPACREHSVRGVGDYRDHRMPHRLRRSARAAGPDCGRRASCSDARTMSNRSRTLSGKSRRPSSRMSTSQPCRIVMSGIFVRAARAISSRLLR